MGERVIFHIDCDAYYASVEEVFYPELRKVPMAVCGNPESRRGIILAKNQLAKGYGVKTAETIWQAKEKCPDLVLRPARRKLYQEYCDKVNHVYEQYSNQLEKFSIDESFLDVTGSLYLFDGDPLALAREIQERVTKETSLDGSAPGLTVSIGISFNKIFAKLASDMQKPNGITVLNRENYKHILWPMPVSTMLMVGKATEKTLHQINIYTIGDLANSPEDFLRRRLGKIGEQLHAYANGQDDSPVLYLDENPDVQSIGNGMTFKRNLTSRSDIQTAVTALADSVAGRLRKHDMKCMTVQVTIKDANFKVITRQKAVSPTWLAADLVRSSMELIESSWKIGVPIRMLTITAQKLVLPDEGGEQLSLFENAQSTESVKRRERLEKAMDQIRDKYGFDSVSPGSVIGNDLGIHEHYGEDIDKDSD